MQWKRRQALWLMFCVIAACAVMGYTDAIWRPGYVAKSLVKLALFVPIPFVYAALEGHNSCMRLFCLRGAGLRRALALGIGVYVVLIAAYAVAARYFDFSGLTGALTQQTGVHAQNFLVVALYIAFCNSLAEEFFFRGFAFLMLRRFAPRMMAYIFASAAFALYHVSMLLGWFDWRLIVLCVAGLFAGGLVFSYLDASSETIIPSWLVHMFSNFAINTIGWILFRAG
jgi:membrane protease YdiL (CAAX protease family)